MDQLKNAGPVGLGASTSAKATADRHPPARISPACRQAGSGGINPKPPPAFFNSFTICFVVVWSFLVWLSIYFQKAQAYQNELAKGQALAQVLAATNIYPLQNQMEPLVSATAVLREPGVADAFIEDREGKPITPPHVSGLKAHFVGETGGGVTRQKDLSKDFQLVRMEQPILGMQNENLGKAVLFYRPTTPHYYWIWFFALAPIALSGFLFYKKSRTPAIAQEKKGESYPWLPAVENFVGRKLYIFDAGGNIAASSAIPKPQHILDLFQKTDEAQEILKHLDEERFVWRNENDEKRFLLVHP